MFIGKAIIPARDGEVMEVYYSFRKQYPVVNVKHYVQLAVIELMRINE